MEISIEKAQPQDIDGLWQLLEENQLPLAGLSQHIETAIVARQHGRIVASAALEMYSGGALLRSVAVQPALQRSGLGRRLTDAALQLAREAGAPAVYLLTTTAERYFLKFGFERIDRPEVPATVQQSVEFTTACPSTATVMRKVL